MSLREYARQAPAKSFDIVTAFQVLEHVADPAQFLADVRTLLAPGGYLAVGSCLSAVTKNQVIAFILAAVACFLFLMSGVELVQSFFQVWAPDFVLDAVRSMSFLTHFNVIIRGVIDLRDVIYFASIIGVFLFANAAVVDLKRGA